MNRAGTSGEPMPVRRKARHKIAESPLRPVWLTLSLPLLYIDKDN